MKKLILMFMVVMATIFTVSCGDSTTPIEDPTFLNAVKGFKYAEAGSEISFSDDGKIMTMKDGVVTLTFTFDGDPDHETQGLYKNDILTLYMPLLLKNGNEIWILDAAFDETTGGITDKSTIDWSGSATMMGTLS